MHLGIIFLVSITLFGSSKADEVQGCGGYVKSDVDIDFSQVGIKLYTGQGSLKYETECAPNDGYYFLPVFDKGQYQIKIAPPSGWSVVPTEVAVSFDGKTDACTLKEDINFHFKGFAVIGQVMSSGATSGGPAGVLVSLHRNSNLVLTTETQKDGRFVFTPLAAGDYTVLVDHAHWSFISETSAVVIKDQNGEVKTGSLMVRGYSAKGAVVGDASQGIHLVLHLKDATLRPHYKKYPAGCTVGAPEGYDASSLEVLCYTTTNAKGQYSFTDLVPGQYVLVAHQQSALTRYVMAPKKLDITIQHGDLTIKETFKVEGFSVRGRVVRGGVGVAGAELSLGNTHHKVTTSKDGSYNLHNVKQGTYTITVTADGLQFPSVVSSVSAVKPTIDDISPSHYRACFNVQLDKAQNRHKQQRWTVAVTGKSTSKQLVNCDVSGRGCAMLVPGSYSGTVQLSSDQQQQGIRFGPNEHSFSVGGQKSVEDLIFSQFLGEVKVTVSCLQNCSTLDLVLSSASGQTAKATAQSSKGSKQVSTTFKDVVPGKYKVETVKNDWCWKQQVMPIEINTKNVEVDISQSGYQLTITSSHMASLSYIIESDKSTGNVEVQQGTTKICLKSSGTHVFTPHSCHQFAEQSYSWNTAEPSLVSLTATHHTITASVHSSEPGAFKLLVKHQDGSSSTVDPVNKSSPKNEYVFEFLAEEHEQLTLTPSTADNVFQYQPSSHMQTIGNDCMTNVVTFEAVKALFIHGKVVPAVAGVDITVTAGDETHEFVTAKDGTYTAGPLDNSQEYSIAAAKQGYTLTAVSNKKGHFEAFKLAEVLVSIVDENKKPLSGVVVSMSGGKSYRQNSMTGEDGSFSFHSLLPGEYFLRFAMKEYSFEPPSKMVTVEQGVTIDINVKGIRVAYSAVGVTSSLSDVMEPGVVVEAVGLGPECGQYQEEASSDDAGAFRIRGLLPNCEYDIGLKTGGDVNRHVERMMPATTRVKVANEDVTGLNLRLLRHFNHMDVVGIIDAPKEHLHTLSVKVYRDDVADSPIHTIKISYHPFFMLPPMMTDGKTYTLQLESSLSSEQYAYRTPEVSFVANSSFKQMKLSFKPSFRNLDGELNHSTMAGLFMAITIIGMVANFEKISPAIDWALDVVGNVVASSRAGRGKGGRRMS